MVSSPHSPLPTPHSLSGVRFLLATPHPGPSGAAISIIHVEAESPGRLDEILVALGVGAIPAGRVALRCIAGVDTGLVARWTPTVAHLMPHGGAIIVNQICERLIALGATGGSSTSGDLASLSPQPCYPESTDLIEACALDAIAHAASPLAIDVILRQRELWRSTAPLFLSADARSLDHLLIPPTVVLLGPPNIGKSTLTNALARRQVSIVADQPGTTRDHVGVMLDLAGLVVRWIDAPGIRPSSRDPIERTAIDLALKAARHADLLLLCEDAANESPKIDADGVPVLRAALRADLGLPPDRGAPPDMITSAHTGGGLAELAHAVREALVPSRLLSARSRWSFHTALA